MAERELKNEIDRIFDHIEKGDNFLLSGGAGSGKTYTLVQCIIGIIDKFPNHKIACITYTNSAVKEIEERIDHKNLQVLTIHDFLWNCIKNFQNELKYAIVTLANNPLQKKINIENPNIEMFSEGIRYMENLNLSKGIISHDELLVIAEYLFENYEKLCDVIKDKFNFILIDEYQDTSELVIRIFLDHFRKGSKKNIIGFFGDAMQSIYEDGIGDLNKYKENEGNYLVQEVKKLENRRSPINVIKLANKVRNDGLEQLPQLEKTNPIPPNMNEDGTIKEGEIRFLYSAENNLDKVRKFLEWDFNERDKDGNLKCKELNLTHNLIAKESQFGSLMDIYNNDQILVYKYLVDVFLKNNPQIQIDENDTFGDAIKKSGRVPNDGKMSDFINANIDLFNEAKSYKFNSFRKIYLNSDILTDDKKQNEKDLIKKGTKRDNLLKHLFKIQNCIRLYNEKRYNEFLKITDYKINSIEDKKILQNHIEALSKTDEKTIGDVIEKANEYKLVYADDKLYEFIQNKQYVYNRISKVKYYEFINLYNYLESFTPFSTQHKTKGREFEKVLVILDRGGWNNYNFEYVFDDGTVYQSLVDGKAKTKSKLSNYPKIKERTSKIFYVCCTRSKEKLAIFYHKPKPSVIKTAVAWFGEENVINIDNL